MFDFILSHFSLSTFTLIFMQLTTPKGKFIEKIIRDKNGRLVRASFCVYECNGRARAHLLSAVLIDEHVAIANKVHSLASLVVEKSFGTKIVFQGKIASPYFSSSLLYSSGSKPRAPTE